MAISLAKKLKIKEDDVLLTVNAPRNFESLLRPLPKGVQIKKKANRYSQIHWFVQNKKQMEAELSGVLSKLVDDAICWIYFPKGTSGIQTDLTRDKGWDSLLAHKELKWLSLISLDETWSGFAMRRMKTSDTVSATTPRREIFNWVDPVNKTVTLPQPLQSAFNKNKKALEVFQALSFTNRKEYIEWIVSAKKDETRENRIRETIERLLKGWKNPRNL